MTENVGIHRLFKLPNNRLNIYNYYANNGIYPIKDDSVHIAVIEAEDAYRNKTILKFRFQKSLLHQTIKNSTDSSILIKFDQENTFNYPGLSVKIPSNTLYRDIYYSFSVSKKGWGSLSDTFNIHYLTEPLNSNITLKFTTDSINPKILDKLLFARIDEKNGLISEGGDYSKGYLTCFADNFGKYIVTIDTTPPEILPVNFTSNNKYTAGQQLTFTVKDNLSGIDTYNAYINDKWVLLQYDLKSDIMFYAVDKDMLITGKIYTLKLFVMDKKNNITVYKGKFGY
jgi:hypothetical protein